MIGETLGKYRITEHLGTGGMAEVYKAYQPGLDRYVAIKVLHSFLAGEENFRMRFQREARVVAMLRHPNIIQVYDFDYDTQHNAYYMVMEFVEGPSLKERLQALAQERRLMPLGEALEIAIAVANALDYAHQRGMVHRDIKPGNIMFGREKQPILSDFGIAKMVNAAALTASGALVGTPAYMAPEQGMGQAGDERSDIYSLGTVLYQLVTGQLPFEADTFMGIVLKHINEPPTPPSALNPALPASVEDAILRAMAKDPDSRFPTAKEFAAELGRARALLPSSEGSLETIELPPPRTTGNWESGTLTEAPFPARVPPPSPPARTGKRLGWLAGVLAGAILLVLAAIVLLASGAARGWWAAPTPPTAAAPTPLAASVTVSSDAIATEVAEALATYVATTGVTPTPSPTPTSTPTSTPTPSPTPDATATALAACSYDLQVLSSEPRQPLLVQPGQRFRVRWEIEASGSCPWPLDVHLARTGGAELRVEEVHRLPPLAPGESTAIEVLLRAPSAVGAYRTIFQVEGGGRRIGPELPVALRVVPPPTPTLTPSPSPTVEMRPTVTLPPQEPLHFSVPVIVACRKLDGGKWWARVGLTAYGGYGDYRYYQNYVSPETEFFNGTFEFEWEDGKAWVGTVIVTSGDLQARWRGSLSKPPDC